MNVLQVWKQLQRKGVALVVIATAISPAAAQSKNLRQADSVLRLAVSSDRSVYRTSDTIRLQTQLFNSSNSDVYIWNGDMCWSSARGLSMRIKARDGSVVHGDILLDCLPPPPRQGDVYAFFRLEPQTFYGRISTFKVSDLVNKPGEYEIEVTFSSSLTEDSVEKFYSGEPVAKLPLWTMEKPTVAAPSIHLTVER